MIVDVFKTVILLSVSGAAVILLILLLKSFTEKRFGAVWQYYIWLVAIAVLLCPFRFNVPFSVPQETSEKIYKTVEMMERVQISSVSVTESEMLAQSFSFNMAEAIAFLWLAVAVLLAVYKIICYVIFKISVYKNSTPEFKRGRVSIRKSAGFASPLLIGILKPVLLIPEDLVDKEELNHVLNHELMHYKRCDILYKWLVAFVKCIHWFNPLVYVLAKEIDTECEISCDIMLTKDMNEAEKKSYMNTVLSLIEQKKRRKFVPFASMAHNKRIIKKRFKMIKDFTMSKVHVRMISAATAFAVCISGVLVGTVVLSIPSHAKEFLLNQELPKTSTHKKVEKKPLEQAVIAENLMGNEEEPDIGETFLQQEQTAESVLEKVNETALQEIKKNTASDDEYVNMEIVEFPEKKDADDMTALIEKSGLSYIKGEFNFEDGTKKVVTGIKPDENGNITLHLSSEINESIQIDFWESESQKGVWGVRIPADGGRAYTFTGFEKGKEYCASLYSPAKENWKIDSDYIIY